MPKISEMIESKYLRKEDISGEALVTISKVGQVNVALDDAPPEMKWAMRFADLKKPMVLNSTNIQLLAKACASDNTEDWVGKQVIVYVDDNVSFQGKLIGGLRIKAYRQPDQTPRPQVPQPAAAPQPKTPGGKFDDMADDIPF